MKLLRRIGVTFMALSLAMVACTKKDGTIGVDASSGKADSIPTMLTRDVKTIISDSGMAKYRITAKLWLVYDEVKVPVWKFPHGLFLEKFDRKFKIEAHVKCDSATFFQETKLWRLDGNVEIKNVAKDEFLTEQLFWSQSQHKIYSDSFIHIVKSDRVIEGYGFESNEQMTQYNIQKVSGIFPVDEERSGIGKAK